MAATLAGAFGALSVYTQSQRLTVGQIAIAVDPGTTGALDLYVPLVDWGVRFEDAIRLPVRLHVELRTVDRRIVARVADGAPFNVAQARDEARDAIAAYLKNLIVIALAAAAAAGLLTAFAVRHRAGPRLRYTTAAALATAAATTAALTAFLPPRGPIDEPQYYAFGPDIPRALEAVEDVQRSTQQLDQELDAQLVGLARLVTRPGERASLEGRPTLTVASDLHNNVLALPILERAAQGGPLLFPGDLTDRGSPLEARLVRRISNLGDPLIFVSGNHDSDSLQRDLAARGAVVLTERGRLNPDGSYGDLTYTTKDGLTIAGYSDPFERRSTDNYRDRYEPAPSPAMQNAFTEWLQPHINRTDVVLVHQPALIEPALQRLTEDPPIRPLVFVVGHTHAPLITRLPGVTVVNGGSVGAGGTGNLGDEPTDMGLARLIYTAEPDFRPLAADRVAIDPGTGSATAQRERLDPN